MNSQQIEFKELSNVPLPQYSYFNKTGEDTMKNSKNKLSAALQSTCGEVISSSGVVDLQNLKGLATNDFQKTVVEKLGKTNADAVTAAAASGLLRDDLMTSENGTNQIKYLACQVAQMHAREYDRNNFPLASSLGGIKEVFSKIPSMKGYLVAIFILSMYLLLQGILGSFDIGFNIVTNIFKKESGSDMGFWLGMILGVSIPFIMVGTMVGTIYSKMLCSDTYNITEDPFGEKNDKPAERMEIDRMNLVLFALFTFLLIAVLYAFGKMDRKMNPLLLFGIMGVFVLLTIMLYVLYTYTPFYTSKDGSGDDIMTRIKANYELYVTKIDDVDTIKSNQKSHKGIRGILIGAMVVIYVMAILFFVKKFQNSSFMRGFFSAGAILILPIIWVFNIILSTKLFYVYPILLIFARGIRYLGQIMLFKSKNKLQNEFPNIMSNNMSRELDDDGMKSYTPSWGLIGGSLLKTLMNLNGYENIYSKMIVENSNIQKNVSQNSYVSSLVFMRLAVQDDKNKMAIGGYIGTFALSVIVSMIILFGIEKV
jgi:hypothetical protein